MDFEEAYTMPKNSKTKIIVETPRKHQPEPQELNSGYPLNKQLKAKKIARKIRSFDHFIYLFGVKGGFYLLPRFTLSWVYIGQILSGEKKLLKSEEVGPPVNLPRFRGIVIENMWEDFKNEDDFAKYFPMTKKGTHIPREYFINVFLKGHASHTAGSLR